MFLAVGPCPFRWRLSPQVRFSVGIIRLKIQALLRGTNNGIPLVILSAQEAGSQTLKTEPLLLPSVMYVFNNKGGLHYVTKILF